MVIKIFAGIVLDGVHRVTGGFISGKGYVDQIFARKQIGEKARKKKHRVYVGFINLEKVYDKVNREALWQCLRMYDVGGNLLSGIKSMYVDSLACARVKGGKSEWFMIDSGVRQGCIISPWLFNIYMDAVMKKMGMGKSGVSVIVWGCVSWFGIEPLVLIHGNMNSEVYVNILDYIMLPTLRQQFGICHFLY